MKRAADSRERRRTVDDLFLSLSLSTARTRGRRHEDEGKSNPTTRTNYVALIQLADRSIGRSVGLSVYRSLVARNLARPRNRKIHSAGSSVPMRTSIFTTNLCHSIAMSRRTGNRYANRREDALEKRREKELQCERYVRDIKKFDR